MTKPFNVTDIKKKGGRYEPSPPSNQYNQLNLIQFI